MGALCNAKPEAPEGFANRLADNWRLMLAIADKAGFGKEARQSAVALSQRSDEATLSIELLIDCHQLMTERGVTRIKSAELMNAPLRWRIAPGSKCRGRGSRSHNPNLPGC